MTGWADRPQGRTSNGHKWRLLARGVIANHCGICVVCGHGGSDAVDHVLPVTEHPELEWDVSNLRPVHHKPCPVCAAASAALGKKPRRCNYVKGMGSLARARRIMSEWTGLPVPGGVSPDTPSSGEWW